MRLILLFIMLFFNVFLSGQIDFNIDDQQRNQVFTEAVYELAFDSLGYLWVGTDDGVIKYDGLTAHRFKNEGLDGNGLNGNYVYDILPRRDSTVWISTYGGGISIYNPNQNNFKSLLSSDTTKSIQENRVTSMYSIAEDSILIHYRGINIESKGVSILDSDGDVLQHYADQKVLDDGYRDRFIALTQNDHELWIPKHKLYRVDKATMNSESIEYPFEVKRWNEVEAIELIDSSLLLGNSDELYSYSFVSGKWTLLLEDFKVSKIMTRQDEVYILGFKKVYKYDQQSGEIELFLDASSSDQNYGLRLYDFEINGDYFWLGTNKGLYQIKQSGQMVNIRTLKSDGISRLRKLIHIGKVGNENNSLFTSMNGYILEETKENELKIIDKFPGEVHGVISNFLEKDNYLLASDNGIFQFDAKTKKLISFTTNKSIEKELEGQSIWSIYNNQKDSILWLGTRNQGLYKYDLGSDEFINFRHIEGDDFSLCYDRYLFKITKGLDNNLWISTDKGLSVINPKTNKFVRYPLIMNALQDFIVHHSAAGNKYMWIGTRDHGLFRYDLVNNQMKVYTTKDGIPFTGANRVIFDEGILYISSRKGVFSLNEETDEINIFDDSEGIDLKELYYSSLSVDETYLNVAAGSSNKIYQIPKKEMLSSTQLNPIIIESIQTSTSDSTQLYYYPSEELNLSAAEDNIRVDFTSVSYDNAKINYRYMLEGYDDRWVSANNSRLASYSHLPGGQYRFIVESSLYGEEWERRRQIDINISTYWYRTWWFYGVCGLLASGLIGFLFKMYVDKIKLEKSYQLKLSEVELKALRTQMNPHFLFNSLNSIKSFIVENDRRNASDYLNKFSKLMRLILNHSKSNEIPFDEELQAIELYVDMERLRFDSFDFSIELADNIEPEIITVPPMIIQPYLENAIWHGLQHKTQGRGKLTLKVGMKSENELQVIITDNGVGREAAAKLKSKTALGKKSYGMAITKERLELVKDSKEQSFKIIDLHKDGIATGTEIRIILPFRKLDSHEK